ncbi:MAG: hypothetical protein WBD31_17180 [Rubripirellula sp.]
MTTLPKYLLVVACVTVLCPSVSWAELFLEFRPTGVSGTGQTSVNLVAGSQLSVDVYLSQDPGDTTLNALGIGAYIFELVLEGDGVAEFSSTTPFSYSAGYVLTESIRDPGGTNYEIAASAPANPSDTNLLDPIKAITGVDSMLLGTTYLDSLANTTGSISLGAKVLSDGFTDEVDLLLGEGIPLNFGRAKSNNLQINVVAVPELSSSLLFAFGILIGGGMTVREKRR